MAGDEFQQGGKPMIPDAMAHEPEGATPSVHAGAIPGAGVPAGRRISFVAWGLAAAAGLALWALIFALF